MKYLLVTLAAVVALIGVAAVVFGGADDSPGLQGLGVIVALAAVALGVRVVLRSRQAGGDPGNELRTRE
jgi:hypothetical protein